MKEPVGRELGRVCIRVDGDLDDLLLQGTQRRRSTVACTEAVNRGTNRTQGGVAGTHMLKASVDGLYLVRTEGVALACRVHASLEQALVRNPIADASRKRLVQEQGLDLSQEQTPPHATINKRLHQRSCNRVNAPATTVFARLRRIRQRGACPATGQILARRWVGRTAGHLHHVEQV